MKKDTVSIHGKNYETVGSRVHRIREDHPLPEGFVSIETEIISMDTSIVVMKASVKNCEGNILGTGHAEELRGASQINKTSALENCETSAIGRALASCGYGGTEYASANEVENAILQQEDKPKTKAKSKTQAPLTRLDFVKKEIAAAIKAISSDTAEQKEIFDAAAKEVADSFAPGLVVKTRNDIPSVQFAEIMLTKIKGE